MILRVANRGSVSFHVTRRNRSSNGPMDRAARPLLLRLHLHTAPPSYTTTMPHHRHRPSLLRLRTTIIRHWTWIGHPGMTRTHVAVDGQTASLRRHRHQYLTEVLAMEHRRLDPIRVLSRLSWASSLLHGTKTMPTVCIPSPKLSLHAYNGRILATSKAATVTTIYRTAMKDHH